MILKTIELQHYVEIKFVSIKEIIEIKFVLRNRSKQG